MNTSASGSPCNWPSAVWQRWADDLTLELGTPVTWGPFGFNVHGVDTPDLSAIRAIAGKP